ncbi:GlcNAc-PI de-N-acetylase [candidate division WOR-1 bacterium RIFOXYA2_FULL_36_21]|uniref:GlcNAc-PI de-N-acetylase n=1 Tax=candidate division WOR-1 bacterium RIFOXYB2_FULL_36_35 TaxID=1802578 RepID=A0A1F4S8B6_UNCSA|nr:MAG: GlcNAc-PI de-N-acetylase [candidate division WOR-1 bacterium RIFOXYA2_FULL_36_21]OGC16688.1 MAG: GlcNAc-PI de-N-acetylase [candidate division WOR-1 bacterium RIFOXYB2_FULL_36_35]OGC16977.1 MAG: GlcNAc-PI de-N-acetylase [candidate division WOR-1 bacterium RIFOXYA12_FULL_36_13]
MKNVLVVAAHPDDEVLGCGGTISKLLKKGIDVAILILGEGITSRYENREKAMDIEQMKELKNHINDAAKILKVKKNFVLNFPDNRFDSVPLLDLVKVIENVKNKFIPDVIFTHHGEDLNIDHQITFNAVLTACRAIAGEMVKQIYCFETLSSTEWSWPNTFKPNVYVDISKTIEKKIDAMKAYKNELKEWPHPRSIKGIEILAEKRGCEVGLAYAEAFELVRSINL